MSSKNKTWFIILFILFVQTIISAQTPGTSKWEFSTGSYIGSSPAIEADGTVYVGSYDDNLYAIKPDGTKKWEFSTGNDVYSSPAIGLDGTIYVGSNDEMLYAINTDGTKKWSFYTGDVPSSPVIDQYGTIYVGSRDDKIYAINADGTKKWEFLTGSNIISSPAIGLDGTIYVGSYDYNLYAINPDGTKKWEFLTGDEVYSSPAIGKDGTIFIGSYDNNLYAINPDGTEKWKFLTGNDVNSSPAVGLDGTIYVGSYDDKLYAINPDGTKKWEFLTGSDINSSPAIGQDGTIYVGSYDNKLYAINPDGTKKWEFYTGAIVNSSPSIGQDGTIYVGSASNLFAIYSDCGGLASSCWPKFKCNTLGNGSYASYIHTNSNFYIFISNTTSLLIEAQFTKISDKPVTINQIRFDNEDFIADLSLPYIVNAETTDFKLPFVLSDSKTGLHTTGYEVTYQYEGITLNYSNSLEAAVLVKDNSELSIIGQRAIEAYQASLDSNQIAAINNKGVIYRTVGAYEKAEDRFNTAVSLALEQFYGFTGIKMNQGVVMSDQGNGIEALDFYSNTMSDMTDEEDSSVIAPRVYYNQAWEYYTSAAFEEARAKAMATIQHKKTNDFLRAKAYVLLGVLEVTEGDTLAGIGIFNDVINDAGSPACIADIAQENIWILNRDAYEKKSVCEGEDYLGWSQSGQYTRLLEASNGGDSIVVTLLTVNQNYTIEKEISICEGENYNGWTFPGEYELQLVSISGCDSIITTKLTVNPKYATQIDTTICMGENYKGWTVSGDYEQQLISINGCDSIVTINLAVIECASIVIDATQSNSLVIYPNPNHGEFELLTEDNLIFPVRIDIYDVTGIKVLSKTVHHKEKAYKIYLGDVPRGLYFVSLKSKENNALKKIMVY